jgi:hypothetical protein
MQAQSAIPISQTVVPRGNPESNNLSAKSLEALLEQRDEQLLDKLFARLARAKAAKHASRKCVVHSIVAKQGKVEQVDDNDVFNGWWDFDSATTNVCRPSEPDDHRHESQQVNVQLANNECTQGELIDNEIAGFAPLIPMGRVVASGTTILWSPLGMVAAELSSKTQQKLHTILTGSPDHTVVQVQECGVPRLTTTQANCFRRQLQRHDKSILKAKSTQPTAWPTAVDNGVNLNDLLSMLDDDDSRN